MKVTNVLELPVIDSVFDFSSYFHIKMCLFAFIVFETFSSFSDLLTVSVSSKLCTTHSCIKGIQVCSNSGQQGYR